MSFKYKIIQTFRFHAFHYDLIEYILHSGSSNFYLTNMLLKKSGSLKTEICTSVRNALDVVNLRVLFSLL